MESEESKRRILLLAQQQGQLDQGISCKGCEGVCCTFMNNSMQVDHSELNSMLTGLRSSLGNDMMDVAWQELRQRCQNTIKEFRLDVELGDGRRSLLRRRYTCPLFNWQRPGCALEYTHKPLGCLAFNPIPGGEQAKDCRSQFPNHVAFNEGQPGNKKPIPIALALAIPLAPNY